MLSRGAVNARWFTASSTHAHSLRSHQGSRWCGCRHHPGAIRCAYFFVFLSPPGRVRRLVIAAGPGLQAARCR